MQRAASRLVWFCVMVSLGWAAEPNPATTRPTADYVPDLAALTGPQSSELRDLVERFVTDRKDLDRFYSVPGSALRIRREREFLEAWQTRLAAIDFDRLGVEGRIDAILLRAHLTHELQLVARDEARTREMAPLLPFAEDIAELQEARRRLDPVDGRAAAATLERMAQALAHARAALEAGLKAEPPAAAAGAGSGAGAKGKEIVEPLMPSKVVAFRAAKRLDELQQSLEQWFQTYDGYDPVFSWWTREPYRRLADELGSYGKFLREKVAGIDPKAKDEPIVGDPIGRAGLREELQHEMIAYTPEELLAIAEREFAWVDAERKRAAREMGFGDDWKAALEKTKQDYVPPGEQPALVRDLALEAMRFVETRHLVTVPPLAADVWLLKMMPPEQQKVAPFFLGGDDILVAYPTDAMTEEEKVQSLRANNRHFARATVFHELVPGHHLQYYWMPRSNPQRQLFETPFWIEGWAVWWEFHLWDLNYFQTPEDRMGTLFWRAHRCARIIFSLKFHLGEWTPQQCIDFLVDRVGHERESATGEVRRSLNGSYPPLYQAGYMLGALQFRELYRQLVASGKMREADFHDSILRGGPMPIELVRARLLGEKLPKDFRAGWRFYDLK